MNDAPTDATTATRAPPSREVLRERERRSRQRRVTKLATIKRQVEALEQAALVVRLLPDPDAIWDEFLDPDTMETRTVLRRALELAKEARQLSYERKLLQELLTERELWRRTVERLLATEATGPMTWDRKVERWRMLTHLHFEPVTTDMFDDVRALSLHDMEQFTWNTKKQTSGMTFMGWHDERHFVPSTKTLHFGFHKTYEDYSSDRHVNHLWTMYSDMDMYARIVLNGRGQCDLEVLQHLSPTACVVRVIENYYQLTDFDVHNLYILFQETYDDGSTVVFLRTIAAPAIQLAICQDTDIWATTCYWIRIEQLPTTSGSSAFRVSLGGLLYGDDPGFAARWLIEALGILLRSEAILCHRPLLHFEPTE